LLVGKELGRGAFARVCIAKLRGERVALKQLLFAEDEGTLPSEKEVSLFLRDALAMSVR
jgi:hypothetical protein